jgi:hypothetical protein
MIRQYPLTPAAGKRLIAKALKVHPLVTQALRGGRLVIVAGTTNGYVAEEILNQLGQAVGFSRQHFFRGLTVAPASITRAGGIPSNTGFTGDIVITKGVWKRAETIFEVVGQMDENDLIVKGANALDMVHGHAASFVDHPDSGAIGAILPAVLGRRVRLLLPVGLEKRVGGDIMELARNLATQDAKGVRLCPLPGEVFTEIDAIFLCTGARAELIGAGGVGGAEGCVWLAIEGSGDQLAQVETLMRTVHAEPAFKLAE